MKILIVDDDPTSARTFAACLRAAGHEVVERCNALGTCAHAIRDKVDLVLLDLEMPALTGQQLVPMIRERRPEIRIVLHSARSQRELEEICSSLGADAFIAKGTLSEFRRRFDELASRLAWGSDKQA
jgi:CheY-like chemotaxis protein